MAHPNGSPNGFGRPLEQRDGGLRRQQLAVVSPCLRPRSFLPRLFGEATSFTWARPRGDVWWWRSGWLLELGQHQPENLSSLGSLCVAQMLQNPPR